VDGEGGSGLNGWMGEVGVCVFGEGRGGYGVGGRVVGVEVLVLVLIVGGERGMFVSSG